MKTLFFPANERPILILDGAKKIIIEAHPEWSNPQKAWECLEKWYLIIWYLSLKFKTWSFFMQAPALIRELCIAHKKTEPGYSFMTGELFGGPEPKKLFPDEAMPDNLSLDVALASEFDSSIMVYHHEAYIACVPIGAGHL